MPLFGRRIRLEVEPGRREVAAGDAVPAAAVVGDPDRAARGGRLELLYRNTFREDDVDADGDRTTHTRTREVVVATVPLFDQGAVEAGRHEAELRVPPDAPGSAPGSVEWSVRAVIDRRRGRDARAQAPLTVLVGPETLGAWASAPVDAAPACPLTLDVGARLVRAGEQITGTLTVAPAERLKARGVRVQLRRRRLDPDRNTDADVPAVVQLHGELDLEPGGRLELPFEIGVPPDATPSFRARHNEQHWHLEGVADVARATDPVVRLEVVVYTLQR